MKTQDGKICVTLPLKIQKLMSKLYRICIVAVLAIVVIGGVITAYAFQKFEAPEGNDDGVRIFIPICDNNEALRDTLVAQLGDSYGNSVYRLWQWQGGDVDNAHGSYVVSDAESALSLSHRLKNRRETPVKVSFNDVRKFSALASTIASELEITDNEFIEACDSILPKNGFKQAEYPAAFLPDTYEFYWTATPEKVVETLLDYRNKFWTEERRRKAEQLGLTPVEVATIASIAEEETAKRDERPKVARLYINRLKKGMKLQADPTVKFAVGDFTIRRITGKYLDTESPYNTYRVQGLPPGPIRIVEKRTLDDVLNAEEHPYLYMCAREDFSGYHNFATDYATHMANARRYQAELDKRNIK
jgi:UPF0755 protein